MGLLTLLIFSSQLHFVAKPIYYVIYIGQCSPSKIHKRASLFAAAEARLLHYREKSCRGRNRKSLKRSQRRRRLLKRRISVGSRQTADERARNGLNDVPDFFPFQHAFSRLAWTDGLPSSGRRRRRCVDCAPLRCRFTRRPCCCPREVAAVTTKTTVTWGAGRPTARVRPSSVRPGREPARN